MCKSRNCISRENKRYHDIYIKITVNTKHQALHKFSGFFSDHLNILAKLKVISSVQPEFLGCRLCIIFFLKCSYSLFSTACVLFFLLSLFFAEKAHRPCGGRWGANTSPVQHHLVPSWTFFVALPCNCSHTTAAFRSAAASVLFQPQASSHAEGHITANPRE